MCYRLYEFGKLYLHCVPSDFGLKKDAAFLCIYQGITYPLTVFITYRLSFHYAGSPFFICTHPRSPAVQIHSPVKGKGPISHLPSPHAAESCLSDSVFCLRNCYYCFHLLAYSACKIYSCHICLRQDICSSRCYAQRLLYILSLRLASRTSGSLGEATRPYFFICTSAALVDTPNLALVFVTISL